MLSPMSEPQPKQCASIASRAAGSDNTAIGMSGSTAVRSRMTKPIPSTSAQATRAKMGAESQAKCAPPRLSASMNEELAAITRMAPMKSSRCGRS